MKKTVFLYSGEGTHSEDTQYRLLRNSDLWPRIENYLSTVLGLNLEELWKAEIGLHRCPASPLLTVTAQACLSDIWRRWGYHPDVLIGHSTGELCAAYQAGLYSLEEVLLLAYRIGETASQLEGRMTHGQWPESRGKDLPLHLSSFNFDLEDGRHVTLSGYPREVDEFIQAHPDFVKMKLPHPWHHPDYARYARQLAPVKSAQIDEGRFVSGVTARFETSLPEDHWRKWLVNPIDFIESMRALKERYGDQSLNIIEIGFHPVQERGCRIFSDHTYVSSMFRGEDDLRWILSQRKKLDPEGLEVQVKKALQAFNRPLNHDTPLADQGFDSLEFTRLSVILEPFFPSLAPQDFYRFKTIRQLFDGFGLEKEIEAAEGVGTRKNRVVVAGMSCRFPRSAQTPEQFWKSLLSREDQVRPAPARGGSEAGFLNDTVTRFDHQFFDIAAAEARAMDPQQILALELTEMLWRDAGIDPETLDKSRVGVYIGVWSQEYRGDRTSAYYPTGTNPSIIASRISYQYDLRGPSWVSNTACSSSLVAVHYAAKDIEAGRVDYAIAGGVNMLLDEKFTDNMRKSGFLSPDNRCRTFDDGANGYVRAEGGGLVLLAKQSSVPKYYAEITGSALNQNGRRSQVITAPHPEAQEELITSACRDAGINPQDIAYVECHGTGTKIGDPIEISALQNTVAKNRKDICYIGSVKSNMGHLESAAGIAGLIKSVAALHYGTIPPNLQFNQPNSYIDFESHPLRVVAEETPIDHQAVVGVSSFGFGGTNAHIIVRGVVDTLRKAIRPLEIPFDRDRAMALDTYIRLSGAEAGIEPEVQNTDVKGAVTREDIDRWVEELFFELTGIREIDPETEMTDQGLDSMSGTELISQLESRLEIEIDPEILFEHPLRDQFVDAVHALASKEMVN